jgi:hypothetical protein
MDDDMFQYKRKKSCIVPAIKSNECCLPLLGRNDTSCMNDIMEMVCDDDFVSEDLDTIRVTRFMKDKQSATTPRAIYRGDDIDSPYQETLAPLLSRESVTCYILKDKKIDSRHLTLEKSFASIPFSNRHESESSIIQLS